MSNGIFKFVQINMKHLMYNEIHLQNLMLFVLSWVAYWLENGVYHDPG